MLKEGYCNYCNQPRLEDVPEESTQEQINEAVTKKCSCSMAVKLRERKAQKETCIENIYEMFSMNYPEIAAVFMANIDNIQDNKFKKITINTHSNQTARMSKTKDGIKVELEKKQKNESLA